MTWREKVKQLENEGKFAEVSRLFAYYSSSASYVTKMQFADKMYRYKAYREAASWYEECFGAPVGEDTRYLTEIGSSETERDVKTLQRADKLFIEKAYGAAAALYRSVAGESRYAMTKLAECYFLREDYKNAKELYRLQAQATDDGYLAFMMGECCVREMANEYAHEHAVYWYRYALEKGNEYAYYPLGLAYQFGRGVEQDLAQAEAFYTEGAKRAVDKDNCYCKLGNLCYERKEYDKAKEYYLKAAALDNPRALLNLAIGGLNRDFRLERGQALCLLAKSAALGNLRAQELYENLKRDGLGY